MIYSCCDENRRAAVDGHPTLNGIDWLEVIDPDPSHVEPTWTLRVRLLKPVPAGIETDNVRIEGGERVRHIVIESVDIASAPTVAADHVLEVKTKTEGDYSPYRLHLVRSAGTDTPLEHFDPRLSAVDFAFRVECRSDFDCKREHICPEDPKPEPDIDYLARDYTSLRRLVVDRLARQMPQWRDRSPADLATTLAELIAYVGDLQHYQLDSLATEAYLQTARRRSSLRRHALLVDYAMHEGCNARAWLHIELGGEEGGEPVILDTDSTRFYTCVPGLPKRLEPDSADELAARHAAPEVFEPIQEATLRVEHNRFRFYIWGDHRCCLPAGATQATLRGHWPDLSVGDVLIFQEMMGPLTGASKDADPTHRHAVRLTAIDAFQPPDSGSEPASKPLTDPLDGTEITEIEWHRGDALPFALCLSSQTDDAHDSALIEDVSIAFGNNLLVDHGLTIAGEPLGSVPEAALHFPPVAGDPCKKESVKALPPRFRPRLAHGPVTYQGTVPKTVVEDGMRKTERVLFDAVGSATAALRWRTADAIPDIELQSLHDAGTWKARRDLLNSDRTDPYFVLEVEDDGSARIRFGDDEYGRRPEAGTSFTATYRVGKGPAGNVGADSILHAVTSERRIVSVTNPLPARGGTAPESAAEVRRHAPHAFRTLERAVTPADYAKVTERLDGVQRAAASPRWTGSWNTVFVNVDREGGERVDGAFASTVLEHLDRYRMAGLDLHINDPIAVSLEIDMQVCVDPDYFRSDVRRRLMEIFSNSTRPDGTRGVFHPDNFSFGQTVYLSPLYAAAREVTGVASVEITRFHRQWQEDPQPLVNGFLTLDRLEVARLDNDPNFPEHGVLRLELQGGK